MDNEPNKTPSKKSSKIPIICSIILAIIAIAGICLAAYFFIDASNKSGENAELRAKISLLEVETGAELVEVEEDGVKATVVDTSKSADAEVRSLINTLSASIAEVLPNFSFSRVYDSGFPLVKPENAKTIIPLNKSYGLYAGLNDISIEEASAAIDAVKSKLSSLGFVVNPDIQGPFYVVGDNNYINKDKNIVCNFSGNGLPSIISCGDASWYSDDDLKLANDLADAYYEKEYSYPLLIAPSTAQIEDSKVSPYQTLTLRLENAIGLYYRVSPDSEWQFFTGTQSVIPCDDYNTKDLKNAFSGEICYDITTGQNSTVQP